MKIRIKVIPKAKKQQLVEADGVIKAYVKEVPDKGKANKALIALIAKEYKVKKSSVRIVLGHKTRNKIVEVQV